MKLKFACLQSSQLPSMLSIMYRFQAQQIINKRAQQQTYE